MDTLSDPAHGVAAVPSTPGVRPHLAVLDGLRGVAILMVMVFHLYLPAGGGWVDGVLSRLAGGGGNGVNLFFVLSGFLITGILWDAKEDTRYFRNFYARRVLRIFPLYYGVLFVGLALLPRLHAVSDPKYATTVQHQIWLWTYLSNFYESWSGRALPLFGHFWSLAVEEQFYLVWPFVVLWCRWRTLVGVCAACFVGAAVVRLGLLEAGCDPALAVLRLTPCQVDGLAAGAFLALLRGNAAIRPEEWYPAARTVFAASSVAVAVIVLAFPEVVAGRAWLEALSGSCWCAFFASGLFLVVTRPNAPGARLLAADTLRVVGKYSYGLYVFHWPLGRLWMGILEKWRDAHPESLLHRVGLFQGSYFLLAAGSSLGVAYLSWHLYEKHFLLFKRHFAYQARRPLTTEAALSTNP